MLLLGAGLQFVVPSSTQLPEETSLAPRRVHEPAQMVAREYPAMLANPIFAPDRKPDATAVPVGGGMSGFQALGIAMTGDSATALVRGPSGIQRLSPGDTIGGWKLVAVALTQLTFERDQERRVLAIAKAMPGADAAANRAMPNFRPGGGRMGMFQRPAGAAPFAQTNQTSSSDDDDDDSDGDDN
jgi:hypothetical protein